MCLCVYIYIYINIERERGPGLPEVPPRARRGQLPRRDGQSQGRPTIMYDLIILNYISIYTKLI